VLLLFFAHSTKARFENRAVENWFHQPSIRSLTSDHDSLFELPDLLGEARRPISPTMNYSFTRVAHGLPCMRTSCAYPAWLRNIQYIRTANFLAIATFATPVPRRNFNR
jgi:hypothetical protein